MTARRAIVSGGASGIGAATVERLLRDGVQVLAFDRDGAALAALAQRSGCASCVGDVTVQADVERAVAAAAPDGRLHTVICAAGVVAADDPHEVLDATWERMLAVNLTGTMRLCRAALPLLRAAGGGAIVTVASVAAFNSTPGSASYAPSKAAVVAYTRNLAYRYGVDGIRANCLAPGWTRTAMAEREMAEAAARNGTTVQAEFDAIARVLALRRMASADEIAACAAFLASDAASFVSGAVLVADGGGRVATHARAL